MRTKSDGGGAPLGVGVIGLGRMGRIYANHVARQVEGARLAAVSDLSAEATAQMAGIPAYADYHDLLADPDIQAVIIATPTSTHRAIVIAAAGAGKAIFCEKPTALTLPETDEMVEAVDRAGVMFQVGFMRRFDRGYVEARRKIEEGVIGEPVVLRSVSRDPYRTSLEYADPAKSGGLVVDMAIHDFDVARWLMGDEIERVYTEAGVLVYPELAEVGDIDNAMVVLRFARGGLGNVEVSRNARYGYDIQCEIIGSEGALRVGYLRETPLLTLTPNAVTHDVVPYFMERFGPAYTAQIEHFIGCIRTGAPPRVGVADARAALQAALAATRSQHTGRVVRVDAAD
ncbi:MAG: inositol 2-dehydrogenase [Anaerolineae bacterium]|nr:inositol 2-dehydrogenase [Anaerolineae bacterium]